MSRLAFSSSTRREDVSCRPARLMKNDSIRSPETGPFGLTCGEASVRAMVAAPRVNRPGGIVVESAPTSFTQRRGLRRWACRLGRCWRDPLVTMSLPSSCTVRVSCRAVPAPGLGPFGRPCPRATERFQADMVARVAGPGAPRAPQLGRSRHPWDANPSGCGHPGQMASSVQSKDRGKQLRPPRAAGGQLSRLRRTFR